MKVMGCLGKCAVECSDSCGGCIAADDTVWKQVIKEGDDESIVFFACCPLFPYWSIGCSDTFSSKLSGLFTCPMLFCMPLPCIMLSCFRCQARYLGPGYDGNCCNDILQSFFCYPCSFLLLSEVYIHGIDKPIKNEAPATVNNMGTLRITENDIVKNHSLFHSSKAEDDLDDHIHNPKDPGMTPLKNN